MEATTTTTAVATVQEWSNFDLNKILGVELSEFDAIASDLEANVNEFDVPKRNGKTRHIIAPLPRLKYILKGVGYRVLNAYKPHDAAHGFVKERGVFTNALPHVGANAVGSIDIKNFFNNVNEDHLKNVLFGNKRICKMCVNYSKMCSGKCNPSLYHNTLKNYEHKCEEIKAVRFPGYCEKTGYQSLFKRIIDVTVFKNHTAQGFPTSPMIANLALRGFDKKMKEHCDERGIVYTRYADDLSFSTKEGDKHFLKDNTLGAATSLLRAFGFEVNKKKTNYRGRGGRMVVCNVVVNDKTSLAKYKVKRFRAEIHNAIVKNPEKLTKTKFLELKGFASYLSSLNKPVGSKYMKQLIDFANTNPTWAADVVPDDGLVEEERVECLDSNPEEDAFFRALSDK